MDLSAAELIFLIPIVAIVGGVLASIVTVISKSSQATAETKEREATKREIAAYVAEGSMSPEEGERLLRAGGSQA